MLRDTLGARQRAKAQEEAHLHVVQAKHEGRGWLAERCCLAMYLVGDVAHICETARRDRFATANQRAVVKATLAVVDEADFVDHARGAVGVKDRSTPSVFRLFLALLYAVPSERAAR